MAEAQRTRKYDPYRNISYAYDGSAARVLDQEAPYRPRTSQRRREQTVERPKVKVREAGQASPFAVCGFAAVAALAGLMLMSRVQLSALSAEVVDLNSQMTVLQSEEATLRARYELAYDLSAIEAQVTADGSMSRPQAGQMLYVDLTEPDSVVVYDNGQEVTGGFLDGVKEIVHNVLSYF